MYPLKAIRQNISLGDCVNYFFPVSCGLVLPITGALNHGLTLSLGSPLWTTTIIYGLAGLSLLCLVAVSGNQPPWREALRAVHHFVRLRWYGFFVLLGGFLGALQHVVLTLVTGSLGSSMYVVGTALGQICGSIILDSTGFAWAPRRIVNRATILGCLIVCTGIVVHKYSVLHPESETHLGLVTKVLLVALTFIQGATTCIKASIGGQLTFLLGRCRRATCYSFISGSLAMALFSFHDGVNLARLAEVDHAWRLISVLCTIYIVTVLFIFQRRLSGAVTYCCVIVGQLISSTCLDLSGWLDIPRRPLKLCNVIGLSIFSFGIAFVTIGRMRQSSSSSSSSGNVGPHNSGKLPPQEGPRRSHATFSSFPIVIDPPSGGQ